MARSRACASVRLCRWSRRRLAGRSTWCSCCLLLGGAVAERRGELVADVVGQRGGDGRRHLVNGLGVLVVGGPLLAGLELVSAAAGMAVRVAGRTADDLPAV